MSIKVPLRPMLVIFCLGASACTSSQAPSGTALTGRPAPEKSTAEGVRSDRDNDADHNDDDAKVLTYGHAADAADYRTVTALIERYFTATMDGDGATTCSLLVPRIAESVGEDYGGSLAIRPRTCPAVMSTLFKRNRRQLARKDIGMKVLAVRVEGDRALVVLDFPAVAEARQITARNVAGRWRVLDLFDGIIE